MVAGAAVVACATGLADDGVELVPELGEAAEPDAPVVGVVFWLTVIGAVVCVGLMVLYVATVQHTTSDKKLQGGG